jgi:hypothetical protein
MPAPFGARGGPRRPGPGQFPARRLFAPQFTYMAVTRDENNAPRGNCRVILFEAQTNQQIAETISDGAGNFSLSAGTNSGMFYTRAYKIGSPDLGGITVYFSIP